MKSLHSDNLAQKWHTMTFVEQMGNIGSEVGRSIASRNRNGAFERALELFDLTVSDRRLTLVRKRELLRTRELYAGAFLDNDTLELEATNKYFYHFAVMARAGR